MPPHVRLRAQAGAGKAAGWGGREPALTLVVAFCTKASSGPKQSANPRKMAEAVMAQALDPWSSLRTSSPVTGPVWTDLPGAWDEVTPSTYT